MGPSEWISILGISVPIIFAVLVAAWRVTAVAKSTTVRLEDAVSGLHKDFGTLEGKIELLTQKMEAWIITHVKLEANLEHLARRVDGNESQIKALWNRIDELRSARGGA